MPQTLFVPSNGDTGDNPWTIPQVPVVPGVPLVPVLPVNPLGGTLLLCATSNCVDAEGVVLTVTLDGVLYYTTGCLVNSCEVIAIPAGVVNMTINAVAGCNSGITCPSDPYVEGGSGECSPTYTQQGPFTNSNSGLTVTTDSTDIPPVLEGLCPADIVATVHAVNVVPPYLGCDFTVGLYKNGVFDSFFTNNGTLDSSGNLTMTLGAISNVGWAPNDVLMVRVIATAIYADSIDLTFTVG